MTDVDRLRAEVAAAAAQLPSIAVVYLFGSLARGEAGPSSDIDLGVVFVDRRDRAADRWRELADLASRLEGERPVDVVSLADQSPIFAHRVLREAVTLYIADEARRVDFESDTISLALDFLPTYELAMSQRIGGLRRWLERRRDA